jgi:uncharacterized RDD family membrane protein YckC
MTTPQTTVPQGSLPAEAGADSARLDGVLRRRVSAFLIDYAILLVVVSLAAVVVGILGVVTLGLGWLLYAVLVPIVVLPYIAFTLGGKDQATPGMKLAGIILVTDNGQPVDPLLAVGHALLFWVFNSILTPLVLLVTLFSRRKRTLHDLLLGTSVVRATN